MGHNADVVILSESNIDTSNFEEMAFRSSKFTNYKFEDKITGGNPRARVSIMIKADLNYERLTDVKDDENPMVTVLFRQKKGKYLAITAVYRQWKAPGELEPNNAHGI